MKILQVIPAISTIYGGPSTAILTIAKSLIQKGVQVDVVTTNADGNKNLNVPLKMRVEKEKIGFYFFQRQIGEWKYSWPLTRWLNNHIINYDIIHIHAVFCYPSWPASRIAKKYDIPYIIRPAGILDPWCIQQKNIKKRIYYNLVEKKNLQMASAIHVTSQLEERSLNHLGFHKNIFVIPHAVENTKFVLKKSPEDENAMRLIFLSRLDPKKGISILLDAMKILVKWNKSIQLTIAGDGNNEYISNLINKIHRLNLENNIKFIGYVDGEKKIEILRQHHLFILPSLQENFALSAAEGLSLGIPVIVSNKVGLAHEIKEYDAGIVVPVGQATPLAEAVMLLWHKEQWNKCSQNAIALAKQRLTMDTLGQNLLQLYETIIKNKKA